MANIETAGAAAPSGPRVRVSPRELALPVTLFCVILAVYALTTAAILTFDGPELLALIPLSGILVVMLFVIGHDACHQSFTSSRRLNAWIGRIAFLPSLHVFSLWEREHNRRHHRFNNIRGMDYAWIPWSPEEFAEANFFDRLKYRFYRDPAGVLFYYLFEIWPQRKLFPRRAIVGTITRGLVLDTVLVWAFLAAYFALLTLVGMSSGRSPVGSIVLAFALPFVIFNMMISAAIYLHHTHYAVPWYSGVEQWKRENGALFGTVHVRFPWIFRKVILNIMEHNAHHLAPGVPLYQLERAQDSVAGHDTVAWDFTISEYENVCGRCKLFDYERGQWTDFKGNATSEPLLGLRAAREHA
jgi:omega-6 fatty acid desaturase (delta-12 desaturase)